MKKFYCTFGCGQPNAGYVLPIIAANETQARDYMMKTYNGKWCRTYTEEDWERWKVTATRHFFPIEEEMHCIDISLEP